MINIIDLLKDAQSGNDYAVEQLIIYIKNTHMNKRISKYLHKNRQVEDEDLRQEFLIGVAFAIPKAKLDIGDPIEYIIASGIYRVRAYLRKNILKSTTQICMDCGYETRLHTVNGKYCCKRCGGNNITTRELDDHDETLWENMQCKDDIENVLSDMLVDKFEKTLDKDTNIYRLYELLIKNNINRDNPQIKNYIKEISILWNSSQQNVLQNIYKLQNKVEKFAKDNNMTIKDNKFIEIE